MNTAHDEKLTVDPDHNYTKYKYIGAISVFIISLITYCYTMAPTTAFWDCGEFIACSYTLGIPHPPGTPLFILIGRVFTIIEFFEEIAVQVNFISALTSALAVLMLYLIIAKAVEYWYHEMDVLLKTAVIVGGSFSGALALTFSDTFWFNAVEAEVYSFSMFIMLLCSWLVLLWMDRYQEPGSEKILILIMYVMFLTAGIHILSMLVIPGILLLVIMTDKSLMKRWEPYYIGFILSMVIFAVPTFIFLVYVSSLILFCRIALIQRNWPLPFLGGIFVALIFMGYKMFNFIPIEKLATFSAVLLALILLLLTFVVKEHERYKANFWFWVVFLCLVAYTPQVYIPIRSAMNPNIDENNPETWSKFQGFLERKQYGQESMLVSMFKRRASWKEQFGMNPHAGLYRFFRQQYVNPNKFWEFFPMIIGLIGLLVQWRRHRITAMYLSFLLFTGSIGLLLYINFKANEVRIRDYFYTPAFVFFSLWIGIGVSGILQYILQEVKEYKLKRIVSVVAACFFMILPAVPLLATAHLNNDNDRFFTHNRHRDFIPWEYAYNILNSCDKNGIIFTNGDNDTFPLWFLQEVKKIRTDVRIVNLSLLNTPWYIKQLRTLEPQVNIRFSDKFIDQKLRPQRLPKAGVIKIGNIPVQLKKGKIFRVQDWMIAEIVTSNNWKKPVYFAVTVSNSNKLGLDPYLKMEGLAFRLYPEKVDSKLDEEKTRNNLWNVYKYNGITDSTIYKNPTTRKLVSNYNAAYFQLALKYHNEQGKSDEAIKTLARADSLIGIGWRGYYLMSQIYSKTGKYNKAIDRLQQVIEIRPNELTAHLNMGALYQRTKKIPEAIQAFETVLQINPKFIRAYDALERVYLQRKNYDKLAQLMVKRIAINPKDSKVKQKLAYYRQQIKKTAQAPPQIKLQADTVQ